MNQYLPPIVRAGASLASIGKQAPRVRSLPIFLEEWSNAGYVDAAKWHWAITSSGYIDMNGSTISPTTGAGISVGLGSGATSGGAINLSTRKTILFLPYGQTALTTIVERVWVEFECLVDQVTRLSNAASFMGIIMNQTVLQPAGTGTRTSNGILGWGFASDVLQAVSDADGTETVTALTTAPTMSGLHRLGISIDRVDGAQFWVDGVVQAAITTNMQNSYYRGRLFFHVQNDQAAAVFLYMGTIRVWKEDLI